MSTFVSSQVISASCNDLYQNFKTNQHIQKTIQINNFQFRLALKLNANKYIQFYLVLHQSPTNVQHIVLFCRLYCKFLIYKLEATLSKETATFKKKNDAISWSLHQLKLANCDKHIKKNKPLHFQCDIQLLQIKEKQYISRFLPFTTSTHMQFEWDITENLINSFKNAKYGKSYYSRDISNIWCLCCYPNGDNVDNKGSLLLSLKLLRLPLQISTIQITFELKCNHKTWTQKQCLFSYASPVQMWPNHIFKTSSLYPLDCLTFSASIQINRVSGMNGQEIHKSNWGQSGIKSIFQDMDFAQDMEFDSDPMHKLTEQTVGIPQLTLLNTIAIATDDDHKVDVHETSVEMRFKEWLCDSLHFDQYLVLFQKHNKADIRKVEYLTDIALQDMDIDNESHRKTILNAVYEFSCTQHAFEQVLDGNAVLKQYKQQLQIHGILTLNDLKREIKSKHDVECVFGLDEGDERIDEIWNTMHPSSNKDINSDITTLHNECKQTVSYLNVKISEIQKQFAKFQNNIFCQTVPLRDKSGRIMNELMWDLQTLQASLKRFQSDSRRTSMSAQPDVLLATTSMSSSMLSSTVGAFEHHSKTVDVLDGNTDGEDPEQDK